MGQVPGHHGYPGVGVSGPSNGETSCPKPWTPWPSHEELMAECMLSYLSSDHVSEIQAVTGGVASHDCHETIVDSGATSSVINPQELAAHTVVPSDGSRSGQVFASASGGKMPNLGKKQFEVLTDEGSDSRWHSSVRL